MAGLVVQPRVCHDEHLSEGESGSRVGTRDGSGEEANTVAFPISGPGENGMLFQ